jgi:hypothetical protein
MLDTVPSMTGEPFDNIGMFRYGVDPISRGAAARVTLPHVQSDANPDAPPWSPQHPLFWFGVVLAATGLGLFGVSGQVKIAKTKASASLGGS